ncbi:TPA: recombinase family protein [Streptococcus suis]|uniref:recombinase family protein n=1 Tax=Streptococcus suis TaxID=1307 RepID=UPI001EE94591|nr:recombinase family protein [Streptococcus suis]MBS7951708.1 recombinase family protein [Streptococcus suis]MBS7979742.1 recombinase family protein [Streptococcus suis]HEM2987983.1 recombinase family protein [Streptococcus suis]HEM6544411.1 recombinase family protein [Streptococcus suis]HEM6568970.1 recombinase family protein [Streptococcus suis]
MNKVAIYVRVSTKGQAEEGYSIDEQIAMLTSYCSIHKWTVYETYVDAGFSGATIDRPALSKLSRDAQKKRFNTVLVYDLKRLGRSQRNNIAFIEDILEKNDIGFISLTENFDTSTPLGKAMVGILSAFGQLDRDTIRERMMMGKIGRAKSGKPMMTSTIAFGYTYDRLTSTLNINQAEAIVVKTIFKEYLGGRSLTKLRDHLNENNILRNGKLWNYQGISRILRNPVYMGMIRFKGEVYQGNHEPIIDAETFETTQVELKKRQIETYQFNKNSRPFRAKYMLSGMIRCGYCGAPLEIILGTKRKDGSRYRRYQCVNRFPRTTKGITVYNDGKKCNSKYYEKEDIEVFVLGQVRLLQLNQAKLDKMFETINEIDVEGIEKQIDQLNNKLKRLNDLYLNDMIYLDELKRQSYALLTQKELLEKELENNPDIQKKIDKENFQRLLDTKDVTTLDYDSQKHILNRLINKVFVKDGHVKIEWKI